MATNLPAAERTDDRPLVLVVDDDPAVLAVVAAGLRGHGFRALAVGDGMRAIDAYRGDPAAVAVALLDVRMPGLDGPGVLVTLRTINPEVRAHFMTGDPSAYREHDLLAAGAGRVFLKPLNFAPVAAEFRRGLELGRGPVAT